MCEGRGGLCSGGEHLGQGWSLRFLRPKESKLDGVEFKVLGQGKLHMLATKQDIWDLWVKSAMPRPSESLWEDILPWSQEVFCIEARGTFSWGQSECGELSVPMQARCLLQVDI